MQANAQLEESLQKLVERFRALTAKHFQELKPIGDASTEIEPIAEQDRGSFLCHLKRLSAAIISVRKNPNNSPPVRDLPVPPYDLFLPFRSETAAGNDASVWAKAISTFNDRVQELSENWAPFSSDSTAEPGALINPELLLLRTRIVKQFEKCNDLTTDFDLFDPSRKAYIDLFERKLTTSVMSADDFRDFITSLDMVFWEGLPNVVRGWQAGFDLPLDLPQKTMAVIQGETFRQIHKLRNKSNHDDTNKQRELAPIYQTLIGVPAISRDDSERWLSLQIAVLENLATTLEQLNRTLGSSKRDAGS